MTITLHAVTRLHLGGAMLVAVAAGLATFGLARGLLPREVLLPAAWNSAVLVFGALMLAATLRYDEGQMQRKVRRRAPATGLLVALAIAAAGMGIYAIFLILSVGRDRIAGQAALFALTGTATIVLSWALVHLLFALEYARLYYAPAAGGGAPAGGLDFPGGHLPNYLDFLYFAFVIGVACQTAEVATLDRRMRAVVLAHGLVAFCFNTVILAVTVNVAAGLLAP